jgi:tRNA-modifying protein YgfZ
MPSATLDSRAFIAVTGPDAQDFLQGIITTDVDDIGPDEAHAGALLTPQGKILYEFLVSRIDGGFLLETDAGSADPLLRRLTLYRLRAKVTIEKRPETATILTWNEPGAAGVRDTRFSRAGVNLVRLPAEAGHPSGSGYIALRIAHGIAGGAEDGDAAEFFPHDLMMDKNGGLDFRKGCYVGQEVVSRMQHRSTARRRVVIVKAEAALPVAGTSVKSGDREIGSLRTVEGSAGLAVVRIDKAGEAMTDGTAIAIDGIPVTLTLPAWSGLEFPASADEAAS